MTGAPDLDENQEHLLRVGAAMDVLALKIVGQVEDDASITIAHVAALQALSTYWTGLLTVQTSANMLLKVQKLEDEDKDPAMELPGGG